MDFGFWQGFALEAVPIGHSFYYNSTSVQHIPSLVSKYGFLGIYASSPVSTTGILRAVTAGINTNGLTCDLQTLIGTSYPKFPNDDDSITAIDVAIFCEWVLASFSSTTEVVETLQPSDNTKSKYIVVGPDAFGSHFVVRDSQGSSAVIEFLNEETMIHYDNDDGITGFGIMTNEPPYPWHVENAAHMDWKRSMARSAVAIPGGFYPDERFLRLHLLKDGLDIPTSYRNKIQQSLYLIDSVTVTPGKIPGTDSGKGEGPGDHTVFGLVYDHSQQPNTTLYWRTYADHSLQRVVLSDLGLNEENSSQHEVSKLNMANDLPWFTDASFAFE
mmetsp:Transcript_12240/g.15739  ORF Transcript_12240/g.15739 Transcript_12240/m.15739 type:complete len:329 (+) Transcript_12240:113-1099(+)